MLLFAYQLRGLLFRLSLALAALMLVYLAFDLGDEGRRLAASLGWRTVLTAALLHLPLIGVQVLPPALLLAALLNLARLRQTGELEAMAVSGGGPRSSLLPLLGVALLGAALALLGGELLVPPCEQRADQLLGRGRRSAITGEGAPAGWLRLPGWFLRLRPAGAGPTEVVGLEHDADFAVSRTLRGELHGGELRGRVKVLRPGLPASLPRFRQLGAGAAATASPELLQQRPEALSSRNLRRRLQLLRTTGRARPAEELLLHSRFAFAALGLVMALVAWPQARPRRGGSVLRDLLGGLLWLTATWLAITLGWVAGRAGWVSPGAGAWLPIGAVLVAASARAHQAFRRAP